jgi:hypothetical protein
MLTKKLHRTFPALLLAAALLLPGAAFADLTVVSKITPSKGKPSTSTQHVTATKVHTTDGRIATIMDLESGRIVQIDHKKKKYWESSLQEMQQYFAQLEEMLSSNPMMEQMLGKATEVDVRKGSETRTVAGYSCQQYFLTMGQKIEFEICAAPDLKPPANYHEVQKLLYATMGPMGARFEKMVEEMKEIDGYPVYQKTDSRIMGMDVGSVTEVTEVKEGPVPASVFEVPAGYKKTKSPFEQK